MAETVQNWRGRRAVVLGFARQGKALARYLVGQGAEVVLSDIKPAEALRSELEELADLSLNFAFGGHPQEILEGTSALFLSGGVPADLEIVERARSAGIAISNDAQLFLERTPATVIGITGSAGKTTTTSLVAAMAQRGLEATDRRVWLGGNIGFPLLNSLAEMDQDDLAVMELSSFQLELMTRSPEIAAFLNLTPDHLDRHGDMESYRMAKARILQFQSQEDLALLNCSDAMTWELRSHVQGRLYAFGDNLPANLEGGSITDNALVLQLDGQSTTICRRDEISLPGGHNQMNILAACVLSVLAGVPIEAVRQVARTFKGVPHRLEHVGEVMGVDWYNDSIATTPDRAIAAIEAFDRPLVLLAGGRDKDLDWSRFARVVLNRVHAVILFGEAADKIAAALDLKPDAEGAPIVERAKTLHGAVERALTITRAGDVVLLSPGGTSFDEFENYEARGDYFRRMVKAL